MIDGVYELYLELRLCLKFVLSHLDEQQRMCDTPYKAKQGDCTKVPRKAAPSLLKW